jgi:hypothetical protein
MALAEPNSQAGKVDRFAVLLQESIIDELRHNETYMNSVLAGQ